MLTDDRAVANLNPTNGLPAATNGAGVLSAGLL
jgi:hypothetical protein